MHIRVDFNEMRQSVLAGSKEVAAHIRALNTYPFGFLDRSEDAVAHAHASYNPCPILLVHGVIHNRSAFFPLKRRMREWGWLNVFSMNYSTRHGSLIGMVEDVATRVDDILKRTGCPKVDIVAHSLGGLVARYYMTMGLGRGKVRRLITLGTAHSGTNASVFLKLFASGSLARDLRRQSYFIETLNKTPIPDGSKIISLYSKNDWTVWPFRSGALEGYGGKSFENHQIEGTGHVGMLYNPSVFSAVEKYITES